MKINCKYEEIDKASSYFDSFVGIHAEGLKKDKILDLIKSDFWPKAVPDGLIVQPNDSDSVIIRARSIVNNYIQNPKNSKILDFGCGNGECVNVLSDAKLVLGYDINNHENWGDGPFTTNFDEVVKKGPFDIILAYDVIDHIEKEDVASAVEKMKRVLAPNGVIILRCHPWTSRHGVHQYYDLNRAYVQFFIDYDEANTIKILKPKRFYEPIFKQSGLKIDECVVKKEEVEDFFKNPEITNIINNHYADDPVTKIANLYDIISMEFIDYKLSHA